MVTIGGKGFHPTAQRTVILVGVNWVNLKLGPSFNQSETTTAAAAAVEVAIRNKDAYIVSYRLHLLI